MINQRGIFNRGSLLDKEVFGKVNPTYTVTCPFWAATFRRTGLRPRHRDDEHCVSVVVPEGVPLPDKRIVVRIPVNTHGASPPWGKRKD